MLAKSNGKPTDTTPPPPLPQSLVQSLPAAAEIVKHLAAIERLTPQLERQLTTATRGGAIELARAFTVFHRLMFTLGLKLKPLELLYESYKVLKMPEALEQAGVTHIPLDAGYRVALSYVTRASIIADAKDAAYQWLRKYHPDLITETVNAMSLSRLARELFDDHGKELPKKLFNVANIANTSVTRTQ